jgi:hypothetical protein
MAQPRQRKSAQSLAIFAMDAVHPDTLPEIAPKLAQPQGKRIAIVDNSAAPERHSGVMGRTCGRLEYQPAGRRVPPLIDGIPTVEDQLRLAAGEYAGGRA